MKKCVASYWPSDKKQQFLRQETNKTVLQLTQCIAEIEFPAAVQRGETQAEHCGAPALSETKLRDYGNQGNLSFQAEYFVGRRGLSR